MAKKKHGFSIPGTGYDVLRRTLQAYILTGGNEVSGPEVAKRAGIAREEVSRNSKFLTAVGVIEGVKKKSLTDSGRNLALAISHDDQGSIQTAWRTIISESRHLTGVLDMIQVQGGIVKADLPTKIAAHFKLPGGAGKKTGLHTMVDILVDAGVVALQGDKYVVAGEAVEGSDKDGDLNSKTKVPPMASPPAPGRQATSNLPTGAEGLTGGGSGVPLVPIHINIELHLPASAEQTVYDAIFKSIRLNLMEPGNGVSDES